MCNNNPIELILVPDSKATNWYWNVSCSTVPGAFNKIDPAGPNTWNFCNSGCSAGQLINVTFAQAATATAKEQLTFVLDPTCGLIINEPDHYIGSKQYLTLAPKKIPDENYIELWMTLGGHPETGHDAVTHLHPSGGSSGGQIKWWMWLIGALFILLIVAIVLLGVFLAPSN